MYDQLNKGLPYILLANLRGMLGTDEDGMNFLRLAVLILDRDLALTIGPEPG
jgi:hypothetical protein